MKQKEAANSTSVGPMKNLVRGRQDKDGSARSQRAKIDLKS